ncbi:hypothetical protein P2H44_24710 [Albimonas sp. CAU 1670]|uniref:hypothetical protein n=1 Tax=Albimonas sp. CAU 1670 TaxID=3032599 RepID=UPI0023D9D2AB|nr:hypothetical protein [Albimonas sp. CAU 1670]MDF2235768.1 hypothetical protein [Albimonas sp. CAU 1670]
MDQPVCQAISRKSEGQIMGGLGSGRRSGWGRTPLEHRRRIEIGRLHRAGCLREAWAGSWTWSSEGDEIARINLLAAPGGLRLIYRVRLAGRDWEDVDEFVPVERTPCRFGGDRPWFRCPGVVNGAPCGRRVAMLYAVGKWFLCRHCARSPYASQREVAMDRALRRANKLRRRLGGEPGLGAAIPRRPKGMWRRTYDRTVDEIHNLEDAADRAFFHKAEALLAIIDGKRQPKRGRP